MRVPAARVPAARVHIQHVSIEGLVAGGATAPISIDTRNAATARAAFDAGAALFNDVSALSHDPESLTFAAEAGATVCLMHASGDPRTMQDNPLTGTF